MIGEAQRREALGPAEMIISLLTRLPDHLFHNRPGMVSNHYGDLGAKWEPVSVKTDKAGVKKVYRKIKGRRAGKATTTNVLVGELGDGGAIVHGGRAVGYYLPPGIYPEMAKFMWEKIAGVYLLDPEFTAKWASWAWMQEHRDLKLMLAAFMLVQNTYGAPVLSEEGKLEFFDDDYRAVGEAMCLISMRKVEGITPKMLSRIWDVLTLPAIAEINRTLGFGKSSRSPATGRYKQMVRKWLRYREMNPKMLEGLVQSGYRTTVMRLARISRYKPISENFYRVLRWKQTQTSAGHRMVGMNLELEAAEDWTSLSEEAICEKIVATRPSIKRLSGMVSEMTPAMWAAAIQAGSLSDRDLIIYSPSLEDAGLLKSQGIKDRLTKALEKADNQRAENIAKRIRSSEVANELQQAADKAAEKVMEEATRDLKIYVLVDISGSMEGAIEQSKAFLEQLLRGFPLSRCHVARFNTAGTEVELKSTSRAAIKHAFSRFHAGGGTYHAKGYKVLADKYPPGNDEDLLLIIVGDQGETGSMLHTIDRYPFRPSAIGFLNVPLAMGVPQARLDRYVRDGYCIVQNTARDLGVPLFGITADMFDDPYQAARQLRHLIESTPVSDRVRQTMHRQARMPLVDKILATDLLVRPAWAS